MSLTLNLPKDPLALVKDHWLLERLAAIDRRLDPVKVRNIFNRTTTQDLLIHHIFKKEKDGKAFQAGGRKIVVVYERAIREFQKLFEDPAIFDQLRPFITEEIARLTKYKKFHQHTYRLNPPSVTPSFVSIQQSVAQQSYLLNELLKPLVAAYNAYSREITNAHVYQFIADLLGAVYKDQDHLNADTLTPAKIKGMVDDIRRTSSRAKLKELRKIIE